MEAKLRAPGTSRGCEKMATVGAGWTDHRVSGWKEAKGDATGGSKTRRKDPSRRTQAEEGTPPAAARGEEKGIRPRLLFVVSIRRKGEKKDQADAAADIGVRLLLFSRRTSSSRKTEGKKYTTYVHGVVTSCCM